MIRPYFDPTTEFQGGSIFSNFFRGFVKERSEMNKQLMELSLAQSDPAFLQKQIALISENIIELQKIKARQQSGNRGDKELAKKAYKTFLEREQTFKSEVGQIQEKAGTAASVSLVNAEGLIRKAFAGSTTDKEFQTKVEAELGRLKNPIEIQGFKIAAKEYAQSAGVNDLQLDVGAGSSLYTNANRTTYKSKYRRSTGPDPDATLVRLVKGFENIDEMYANPEALAAVNSSIDDQIEKYETKLQGYEARLEKLLDDGTSGVFEGVSRNYMLDNPFVQMSRQQGQVDALAAAIEESSKLDFTKPFEPDVETRFRDPVIPAKPGENFAPDDFEGGVFTDFYEENIDALVQRKALGLDPDEEFLLLQMGDVDPTIRRKRGDVEFSFKKPEEEEELPEGGQASVAQQNLDLLAGDVLTTPDPILYISRDDAGEALRAYAQPRTNVSPALLELQRQEQIDPRFADLGTGIGGVPSGEPLATSMNPNVPVQTPRNPLTAAVRESNLFSAEPLQQYVDTGEIILGLSDDGREITYTPNTPAARDELLRQTRRNVGLVEFEQGVMQ